MATIKDYLDYSELAQAAYGNLEIGTPDVSELINKDRAKFTQTQAANFAERYKVKAVYSDTVTGFSATLFEDKSGKKIFAIRGTDEITGSDFDDDILQLGIQKTLPAQFESLVSFFESLKSSGKIKTTDNFVVTGHSLGGALTQLTTAVYKDYVDAAYTYNSPGVKNLSVPNVMEYQGEYYRNYEVLSGGVVTGERISKELYDAYQAFKDNKLQVDNKVINVEAKDGPSIITDLGTDIGSSVEEVFINADKNYLYNHSNKTLTDTLSFYNTLSSIDSTLTLTQITNFLEEVDKSGVINKDKLNLHQEILNRMADIVGTNRADTLYDMSLNIIAKNIKSRISLLINKPTAWLNDRSLPNLYALLHSNPFTIAGNLPAYADLNPDDYSDAFMKDRADYMYYILGKEERYGDGSGKDSYKAFDSYGVSLEGDSGDKVIFGTDYVNNALQPKSGDDELVEIEVA